MQKIRMTRSPLASQRVQLDTSKTEYVIVTRWVSLYQRFYMSIYDTQGNQVLGSIKLVAGCPVNLGNYDDNTPQGLFVLVGKGKMYRRAFEAGAYTLYYIERGKNLKFPLIREYTINNDVQEFLLNNTPVTFTDAGIFRTFLDDESFLFLSGENFEYLGGEYTPPVYAPISPVQMGHKYVLSSAQATSQLAFENTVDQLNNNSFTLTYDTYTIASSDAYRDSLASHKWQMRRGWAKYDLTGYNGIKIEVDTRTQNTAGITSEFCIVYTTVDPAGLVRYMPSWDVLAYGSITGSASLETDTQEFTFNINGLTDVWIGIMFRNDRERDFSEYPSGYYISVSATTEFGVYLNNDSVSAY